jgi:hypothetical protein
MKKRINPYLEPKLIIHTNGSTYISCGHPSWSNSFAENHSNFSKECAAVMLSRTLYVSQQCCHRQKKEALNSLLVGLSSPLRGEPPQQTSVAQNATLHLARH